jgi:hypothetical protein
MDVKILLGPEVTIIVFMPALDAEPLIGLAHSQGNGP